MTLWLYLTFPSLQLDAIYGDMSQPIAIVDDKNHHIVQLNAAAQTQGIKIGMGLGTAASLCRDLNVHPYNEMVEQDKLKDIANWLYALTSDISLSPPQGLLLQVSNMLSLYASLADYWQCLKPHLDTIATHYHYATAYSPEAARLLAEAGLDVISEDKPWLVTQLHSLPIQATSLANKVVDKLNRVGIHNLSQLIQVPFADLSKRFDHELVTYIGRLTGQFHHPVTCYLPPEQFEHYLELLFDIDNTQWLLKPLTRLLKSMEVFLNRRNQRAEEILLTLYQRDHDDKTLTVVSAQGEYKHQAWLTLCELNLENIQLDSPVTGLSVAIERMRPQAQEKSDLFAGRRGALTPLELVSVLQAKLGKAQVCGLTMSPDYRPEYASQANSPFNPKLAPITYQLTRLRPSVLHASPYPLTEQVSLCHGPERIVSGWWDNQPIIRDYFIGRTQRGHWLWLYRTHTQHWFVHGVFS